MCVNTGKNIELTADEYFSSLYEQDVKDYLELEDDMKDIIKDLALKHKEDVIECKNIKNNGLSFIKTKNNNLIFGKILSFMKDKYKEDEMDIILDYIQNGYFIYLTNANLLNNGYASIKEIGFHIRLINIRKFLLMEKEQQELKKIMSNNNENKKRRL